MKEERTYVAIDLKSFYASVECVERKRDPLTTNLVVADESRTEKTICLAVSPSLKSYGISGRARLFEVVQQVRQINTQRLADRKGVPFEGECDDNEKVKENPALKLEYIVAPPRMALYIQYSTRIYQIYLRHVAPEDIHVYSIDEVFIDATRYLKANRMNGQQFCKMLIDEVYRETKITATGGVGTNMYLAKIAMDIVAKHMDPDGSGARIAVLDEMSYRLLLWNHRPLTDFWRVGVGYARKLEAHGMYTMGDVARCALTNEDLLYRLFGINAELLIDHSFGWEPCTIEQIRAYRPASNSLGAGQVLHTPYEWEKARIVLREMTDRLVLDLVDKGLVTDQMVLTVGYDITNLSDPERRKKFKGEVTTDWYHRQVPKHAHGTANLPEYGSSTREIIDAMLELYDRITDPILLIRRLTITANHVIPERQKPEKPKYEQMDLFTDYEARQEEEERREESLEKEKRAQKAILEIQKKYGKNAILKGTNLKEGATAKDRNQQIGGHKA